MTYKATKGKAPKGGAHGKPDSIESLAPKIGKSPAQDAKQKAALAWQKNNKDS